MKIGCCFGHTALESMRLGRKAGFEFAEVSLFPMDKASDAEIKELADCSREIGLPITSSNCFFPSSLCVVGENVDCGEIDDYICRIFEKTAPLNMSHVVFGSGKSRNVPEGYSRDKAFEQLVTLCRDHIAPVMEKHGMICGVEELFRPASNIINSCAEAMELVRAVNSPRIKLLVDLFHIGKENEPIESLTDYAGFISHVHISSPKSDGEFPRDGDGEEYKLFFDTLRKAGYPEDGMVSIEGHPNKEDGFFVSAERSVKLLKSL